MFQPHLVNDEDLVVFLGHLLSTVWNVAATVLRVHLNTMNVKTFNKIAFNQSSLLRYAEGVIDKCCENLTLPTAKESSCLARPM